MSHVTAKFASAFLSALLAGAVSTALLLSAPSAPPTIACWNPDDDAQGKHWYYRIERGTGRKCW